MAASPRVRARRSGGARRWTWRCMTAGRREKMLAGERHLAPDPELIAIGNRARALLRTLNQLPREQAEERAAVLRELLGGFGRSWIELPFTVDYGRPHHDRRLQLRQRQLHLPRQRAHHHRRPRADRARRAADHRHPPGRARRAHHRLPRRPGLPVPRGERGASDHDRRRRLDRRRARSCSPASPSARARRSAPAAW